MVIKQPDGPSLLALERQVRERGTALEASALQGSWRLQQVWSKGASASSPLSNWALQGLRARLELTSFIAQVLILMKCLLGLEQRGLENFSLKLRKILHASFS